MTLQRTRLVDYGIGEEIPSAELSAIDAQIEGALDKRSGETDTLSSVVSCSGSGRLIGTYVAGADADTTYLVSGANSIIDVPALTANRIYTLSNTSAVAGDRLSVLNRSGFYITVKNAAASTLIVLGAQMDSDGESVWADFLFTGTAWVLYKSSLRPTLGGATYLTDDTYIGPRGITLGLAVGYGAGAGGGGAWQHAGSAIDNWAAGGAGGGGAWLQAVIVVLTPGGNHAVVIGPAGGGGAEGTVGSDGGDTTFNGVIVGAGAQGGGNGSLSGSAATYIYAVGGGPVRGMVRNGNVSVINTDDSFMSMPAGSGGHGKTQTASGAFGTGSRNPTGGYAGGAGGVSGSDSGSYRAGGGGGGGGAGPGGDGGAGGNGGNGNNAGVGSGGGTATAGAANTGAGGGGGGAAGNGSAGAGASKPGAAGGTGKLTIIPLR